MAKADLLSILYSKEKSPLEFKFDSMWVPSMYNFITPQDIAELHYLASSAKFSSKIDYKYKEIDRIMTNRGFKRFHCGTNRIVYSYLEDQSFLIKIALDKVGLGDNPAEYRNQFLLKPFVTKVFEVSPCGTVAMVERVEPITSRQEFISVAEDIYDLMNQCIIGRYILEDVGTNYFMNWGLRKGFGAVLLDYTYVYELDGNKLFCNKIEPLTGEICNGTIDYDNGFNNLICSKCGKRYLAKSLEQSVKDKLIILKEEGEIEMKITLTRGNETLATYYTNNESETIIRRKKKNFEEKTLKVSLSRSDNTIADKFQQINQNSYYGTGITEEDYSDVPQIKVSLRGGNNKPKYEKPRYEYQPKKEFNQFKRENKKVEPIKEERPVYQPPVKLEEKAKGYTMVETKVEKPTVTEEVTVREFKKEEPKNIDSPIYTRDVDIDRTSKFIEPEVKEELVEEETNVDMLAKLGLSDADFEEPKEDIVTEIKVQEEDKEDPMAKYYEEYSDEIETFQPIKKGGKKNIMENY